MWCVGKDSHCDQSTAQATAPIARLRGGYRYELCFSMNEADNVVGVVVKDWISPRPIGAIPLDPADCRARKCLHPC